MRKNMRLALALVMILPAMFFLVSCAKKTEQSQSAQTLQSEVPEVPKEEDRSAEEAAPVVLRDEAKVPEATGADFVNENIHFALDSSALSDQAQQILNNKAEYLRTKPRLTVTVAGHCDERGTEAYNITLGERRAKSVKDFLVSMGISADRLSTVSYGEEHPIALGRDEVSWAKNRRAQLVINLFPDDRKSGMNTLMTESRHVVLD